MNISLPDPSAVAKVDGGRGFVSCTASEYRNPETQAAHADLMERFVVVTAAHCLPSFPPANAASNILHRTFKNLLASLDGSKRDVWAEGLVGRRGAIRRLHSSDEKESAG